MTAPILPLWWILIPTQRLICYNHLKRLLEDDPEYWGIHAVHRRIMWLNKAQREISTGPNFRRAAEVPEQMIFHQVHPDDVLKVLDVTSLVLKTGKPHHITFRAQLEPGRLVRCKLFIYPVGCGQCDGPGSCGLLLGHLVVLPKNP